MDVLRKSVGILTRDEAHHLWEMAMEVPSTSLADAAANPYGVYSLPDGVSAVRKFSSGTSTTGVKVAEIRMTTGRDARSEKSRRKRMKLYSTPQITSE